MYLLHNMSYWSRVGKQTVSLNKPSRRSNIWLLSIQKMGEKGRTYHPIYDVGANVSRPCNGINALSVQMEHN